MARVHVELLESFRRLPLRSLQDVSHACTVVDWLPAPGWSHEREHIREVRAWWRRHRRVAVKRAGTVLGARARR